MEIEITIGLCWHGNIQLKEKSKQAEKHCTLEDFVHTCNSEAKKELLS